MEESKAKIETQFKLLDLGKREIGKNNCKKYSKWNSETFKSCTEETRNDTRYEIQSAEIYGFQWKTNGKSGRKVKSVGKRMLRFDVLVDKSYYKITD